MKLLLALVIYCSTMLAAFAQEDQFNISNDSSAPLDQASLSATLRDIVLVETPSHGNAVIQFTGFRSKTASYRWRYRACATCSVQTGTGKLKESYDRRQIAKGKYEVTARTDHAPILKAGSIELEWSYKGKTSGWLYYHPDQAKVQIMPNIEFENYP